MHPSHELLEVVREAKDAFEKLGIAYAVGGSLASSLHGKPRFTQDADVAVEPFAGKEQALVNQFGSNYFVSLPAVQEALAQHSSFRRAAGANLPVGRPFRAVQTARKGRPTGKLIPAHRLNIIHTPSSFKVDVFVRQDRPFDISAMSRRRSFSLPDPSGQSLMIVSPEDVILFKLEWYRLGGETSTQQWQDVIGVLQTQGPRIDQPYLDHWAADLRIDDLLQRTLSESGT